MSIDEADELMKDEIQVVMLELKVKTISTLEKMKEQLKSSKVVGI